LTNPTLSIIVPAFNEAKIIENCLYSLFSSKYPVKNYELIVVNDGSTDETERIVNNLINIYPNLKLFSKPNGGKASAQNLGIKHAKGKFIIITDADSTVPVSWLETISNDLKSYDIVLGGYTVNNPSNFLEKVQESHYLLKFEYGAFFGRPQSGVNIGFRKDVIDKIGYFNENKTSTTEDFIVKAEEYGLKIFFNRKNNVQIKCPKTIKNFFMQQLRWRNDFYNIFENSNLTFTDIVSHLYCFELSILLVLSLILSIILFNFAIFAFLLLVTLLFHYSLYLLPLIRMFKDSRNRSFIFYFIIFSFFEIIIRILLIPYLIIFSFNSRHIASFNTSRD